MPPKKHKKGNQNVRGNPAKRIRRPSRRVIEATPAASETSDVPCAPASNSGGGGGGGTLNASLNHVPSAPQVIPQPSSARQGSSRQSQGQLPTDQSMQHSVGTAATVATFSGFGSIYRPNTNTTTPRDLAVLTEETNRLLMASMAESTWQTYKTASDSFNRVRYLYGLPLSWPAPLEHIIQFIASMSAEGKACGSIRTYISGLSYMYKIHGLTDITKSFIVTKLLEGAARQNPTHDTRAPITLNILITLLQALEKKSVLIVMKFVYLRQHSVWHFLDS
ncbi:uncharacterized protein LOC128185011 [Crassostrea angulata]|uniref:uncharacterized protein LOC128185011 n=1 Tax=Magallana angulata TaxID=2784310 RepID=UPI0022B1C7D7|nr:uncharacterized protein LOC128185011 [Crassostrea angulata]